ncbi:hypothetical protein THAR02_02937 [Trichoderma harzianum]|uniref:O-methyltransferase domain-containing protein n=1 Tax=Trichoderma harzianum TaxID=5544 RepID=A0A0F9XJ74_TRIHA|nr:hypothetical protein THAR02_02937 [Trichoderma harzianum]
MDQDTVCRLQELSKQLEAAVQRLGEHAKSPGRFSFSGEFRADKESVDERRERERAKACVLAVLADMKTLICEPRDFLQQLACQVRKTIFCITPGSFQSTIALPTFSFIFPPSPRFGFCCARNMLTWDLGARLSPAVNDRPAGFKGGRNTLGVPVEPERAAMAIKDLSDLAGVPEALLSKIVRLTSTYGFLQEVQPGFVSHTRLSAQFLADHSLLDAATFLADSVAPAALHMINGVPQGPRFGSHLFPSVGGGVGAVPSPFFVARQERPKLNRQWIAYLRHAAGLCQAEEMAEMLARLNWANISNACIVEVNAASTDLAESLLDLCPMLNVIVQIPVDDSSPPAAPDNANRTYTFTPSSSSARPPDISPTGISPTRRDSRAPNSSSSGGGNITVTHSLPGQPQTVTDAAVYILHLPAATALGESSALLSTQLQDHLDVLRGNGGLLLILTPRVLPQPGSDRSIEGIARARDLAMIQLAEGCEMEMGEFSE